MPCPALVDEGGNSPPIGFFRGRTPITAIPAGRYSYSCSARKVETVKVQFDSRKNKKSAYVQYSAEKEERRFILKKPCVGRKY